MRTLDPSMVGGNSAEATVLDNLAIAFDNSIISVGALPNMAQGTGTNTSFKSQNTVIYKSSGIAKSKATFEVAGTAGNAQYTGVQDVTPNANSVQERVYIVYLDGAGNATVIAGPQATGSGNALFPDMPSAAPAAAAGPEGLLLSTVNYPTGVNGLPLGLRTAGLTPIGGCRIAVAAGATGFRMGTTQPATAGAITATYFDGYPTPQLLTAQ